MNIYRNMLLSMLLLAPVGIVHADYYYYGEGPYIGFSAGAAEYDIAVENWDDGSITSGQVDDSDAGVKFYWGYDFSRFFGIELFYANLGETSFEGVSDGTGGTWLAGDISGFTENDGYGFSAHTALPIGSYVDLFAKAGIFRWTVRHREFDSGGTYRFSDSGSDTLYGGGLEINFTDRNSVRAEWERYTDVYDIYDIDLISLGFIHRF